MSLRGPRTCIVPFLSVLAACGDSGRSTTGTDGGSHADAAAHADASSGSGGQCGSGHWYNASTAKCADCPVAALACASFDLPSFHWDSATKKLTLAIRPALAEIEGGSMSYDVSNPSGTMTRSVQLSVNGDTLSADLSATLPADAFALTRPSITLIEACGTRATIGDLQITTDSSGGMLALTGFACP